MAGISFHILGEQQLKERHSQMAFEKVAGWKSAEHEQASMKAECYKGKQRDVSPRFYKRA